MLSTDQQTDGTTAAASTVGSTDGNVLLHAGQTYRQVGSDVITPQGSIDITAQRVDILEARETSRTTVETKTQQSGFTLAITSPIISAIQTAQQGYERAAADGLCDEGAWEVAIDAVRSLDVAAILRDLRASGQ